MSSQRFLDYGVTWMRHGSQHQTLVVATSASGGIELMIRSPPKSRSGCMVSRVYIDAGMLASSSATVQLFATLGVGPLGAAAPSAAEPAAT